MYSIYSDIPLPNYTIDRATIPTTTILVEHRDGATRPIRCLLMAICSSVPAPPDVYEGIRDAQSITSLDHLVAKYVYELLQRPRYEPQARACKAGPQTFS